MKLRLAAALLALAPLPAAGAAPTAPVVEIARPTYLNIVVDSAESPQLPPRWRVEGIANTTITVGDLTLTPAVDCSASFQMSLSFEVSCTPRPEPPVDPAGNGTVVIQGRRCQNPAVRAEIGGPAPGEAVTGTITCGYPQPVVTASCTATANTIDPVNGGFSGTCLQNAPDGPMPIRCKVDLTRVWLDHWRVTCMGTDP